MTTQDKIPVAVIGCGRMGRLHARVYSQMPQVKLVGVFDINPDTRASVAEEYRCEAFADLETLAQQIRACTIAAPTVAHADLAEPFLRRGIACLIEKPLAKDIADARRIVDASRRHNALVQVGHIERFNPAIVAMRRLNVQPRFMEVTRVSPLTFRSIDVGVVLDMMIHDIDIVLRLANSPVQSIDATGVSVIGEVEDIASARIRFANGCIANITASRLALKTERKLRIFSPDAYISVDYQKKVGMVASKGKNVQIIRDTVAKIRSGEIADLSQVKFDEMISIEELPIDDIEPIRAELESFVDAVVNKKPSPVPAEDGLAAVEVATRIVELIGGATV